MDQNVLDTSTRGPWKHIFGCILAFNPIIESALQLVENASADPWLSAYRYLSILNCLPSSSRTSPCLYTVTVASACRRRVCSLVPDTADVGSRSRTASACVTSSFVRTTRSLQTHQILSLSCNRSICDTLVIGLVNWRKIKPPCFITYSMYLCIFIWSPFSTLSCEWVTIEKRHLGL